MEIYHHCSLYIYMYKKSKVASGADGWKRLVRNCMMTILANNFVHMCNYKTVEFCILVYLTKMIIADSVISSYPFFFLRSLFPKLHI